MNSLPRVRSGLLRHSLDQQVLVYDSRDDRVHLLDPTTACVLELLEEGGWTPEGITHELASRLGVVKDPGLLALALDQLGTADLLDNAVPTPAPLPGVARRELVRRLAMTGAAALLIPAVATLTAPRGYAQGTPVPLGQCEACTDTSQCANPLTCTAGVCGGNGSTLPNGAVCSGNGNCCSNICLKSGGPNGICQPAP